MVYNINKGIDRPVEFYGLKSQYLILFAAGLVGNFLSFVVLYMVGISRMICIVCAVLSVTALVWSVFYLNKRFGRYGLMKRVARNHRPRCIVNRKRIESIIKIEGYAKRT